MFGGSGIHLILHFKHDGDIFRSILVITEDEVTLSAIHRLIIFLKVCLWHHRTDILLKLDTTVLL